MKKTGYLLIGLCLLLLLTQVCAQLRFQKQINPLPLPAGVQKGAFHVHSRFSDGRGDIFTISRAAARRGLDFVLLSDHGRPNRYSLRSTFRLNGTLLVGGAELSLHSGHLVVSGIPLPAYLFPPEPDEAIAEINRQGGISFIAHPLDRRIPWTDWSVTGFSGMEILSLYSSSQNASPFKLLLFPLNYLLGRDYALTSIFRYPSNELNTWDRFNRRGRYFGIYALDAHGALPFLKGHDLPFPTYEALFGILTVYVQSGELLAADARQAAAGIVAALKQGRFFNTIESLGPANGFKEFFIADNGQVVPLGGMSLNSEGVMVCRLPFDFATDLLVKKDGEIFQTFHNNRQKELRIPIHQPGVYRSEVFLSAGPFTRLPWILANPFFIGQTEERQPPAVTPTPHLILPSGEADFRIEKNPRSNAALTWERGPAAEPVLAFSFHLEKEPGSPDFWSALASIKKRDLSGYRGFVFEVQADRRLLAWVRFRNGSGKDEKLYQHSFLADSQWQRIAIPFNRFHQESGQTQPPDLVQTEAFFFLVDGGCAYSGQSGTLRLKNIGLY